MSTPSPSSGERTGALALAPLRCTKCGGMVPLGEADRSRCPFCGDDVPIPEDHLALRAADRAHTSGRERATELYRRLGEPPGRALLFWARAGTIALWCLLALVPVALLLWIVVIAEVWRLAPYVGFQAVDVIGGVPLSLLLGS